jgi:hypothetical protein
MILKAMARVSSRRSPPRAISISSVPHTSLCDHRTRRKRFIAPAGIVAQATAR